MAETIDDRSIINNALGRIGASRIRSLSETTPLCAQVKSVYYDRIDGLLGLYTWSFNAFTFKLDRLPDPTNVPWRCAFALPGTKLSNTPRRVMLDPRQPRDLLRSFMVEGDALYADHECVYATFGVRADPAIWPGYFRLGATIACAADFAVPVTHDVNLKNELTLEAVGEPRENGAGGLIGQAIRADAAGARNREALWDDPLTRAHGGGSDGPWHGKY